MFNIFRDTIAKDLTKIADYFNAVADAGTIFKDKRALAVNRIKNAVLNGDIGGGGVTPEIMAEIENAQWKEEPSTPLFSETVTTENSGPFNVATLAYSEFINADTITVIFDGTEYTCDNLSPIDTISFYGAPATESGYDFSEYPFTLGSRNGEVSVLNEVYTETPGTHTVSASTESTTYTESFIKGVNTVAGWKEETSTPLFSETVTTVDHSGVIDATLTYSTSINSDALIVTFDGVEYTCPINFDGHGNSYGATYDISTSTFDFTDFPFCVYSAPDETIGDIVNSLVTETAGEHTVVAVGKSITYTPAFVEGVKKNSAFIVHFSSNNEGVTADKTASEILQAYDNGYFVIGVYHTLSQYKEVYYLQDIYDLSGGVSFVNYAVRFVNNAPTFTLNYITSNTDDINTFTNGSKPIS